MIDLCPRCAKREIEPGAPSGWCADCVVEDLREKYGDKQRSASIGRHEDWSERSQQTWDRDRQRVHRLRDAIRPKDAPSHADPWEVAAAALAELSKIRSVRMRAEQHARLDLIAEALRRLAWGPEDEPPHAPVICISTRRRLRGRPQIPGQLSLFPELAEVEVA